MKNWEVKDGVMHIQINKPQPKQLPFFKARNMHIAYGGAAGSGKSWAMRIKLFMLCYRYENLQVLLLRRTYPRIYENHIKPLLKIIPRELAKYNETKKEFKFINGSVLKLGSCQYDKSVHDYHGAEYDVIGMEEATEFTEYQRDFLTSRLRTTRTDFDPRMYYTANPGGVGHSWFKRLFVDRDYKEDEKAEDYIFFRAKITDNKVLMNADPKYYNRLKNLPEDMRKAYLDGNWDVFQGQYFSEWNRDKHVCEPFEIPSSWERILAFDYGQDMTACLWGAVSPKNELFIYRELYEPNLILSEAAKAILRATPKNEIISCKIAPPDLWNRRQERGVSGVKIMKESGLSGLRKANNERISGWRAVKEKMHYTGEGMPSLRIFRNCHNLIRCLPLLQFDQHHPEDVAKDPHELTHAPEALRYMVMRNIKNIADEEKPKETKLQFEVEKPKTDGFFGFGGNI